LSLNNPKNSEMKFCKSSHVENHHNCHRLHSEKIHSSYHNIIVNDEKICNFKIYEFIFWKKKIFAFSTRKLTVGYIILLSLPKMSVPEWVGAGWWKSAANFLMHILFWSYMNANSKNLCNRNKLAELDFWINSCFVAYALQV